MGAACEFEGVEGVDVRVFLTDGVKGSLVMSGNEASFPGCSCARNSIDLTKTTWQFSGYILAVSLI